MTNNTAEPVLAAPGNAEQRLRLAVAASALVPGLAHRSAAQLAQARRELGGRIAAGQASEPVTVEALGVVAEAVRRATGENLDETSMMAGLALASGQAVSLADASDGDLIAAIAAYLFAVQDAQVHMIALDDVLARQWSARLTGVFEAIGVSAGVISGSATHDERQRAYQADLVYGGYREFCYDYLRDSLARNTGACVQPSSWGAAILADIDKVLVDCADSLPAIDYETIPDAQRYSEIALLAGSLERGSHYAFDPVTGEISLDWAAMAHLTSLPVEDPRSEEVRWELRNAVRARLWYKRGKDYSIGRNGVISSGRTSPGDRFRDGVQQAIEAREGLTLSPLHPALARITVHDFFCLYASIGGVSMTARAAAAGLSQAHHVDVVELAARKPGVRADLPDLHYETAIARLRGVISAVESRISSGQPVVVGATSLDEAERVSQALADRGIPHSVLGPDDKERVPAALNVAGLPSAVTVIVGDAARGYDIWLGDPTGGRGGAVAPALREQVISSGGLAMIGISRNRSRRTDDWLRGLAGRRGEPGESQFYLSAQDPLLRDLSSFATRLIPRRLRERSDGTPVGRLAERVVSSLQQAADQQDFERRMAWLKLRGSAEEAQREQFYAMRRNILLADDLDQFTREIILAVMDSAWSRHLMDLDMISEYATRRGSTAVYQDQAARSYEILLDQINEYLRSHLANGDIRAS